MWINDYDHLDKAIDQLIQSKRQGAPIQNSFTNLEAIKQYFRLPDATLLSIKKTQNALTMFLAGVYDHKKQVISET